MQWSQKLWLLPLVGTGNWKYCFYACVRKPTYFLHQSSQKISVINALIMISRHDFASARFFTPRSSTLNSSSSVWCFAPSPPQIWSMKSVTSIKYVPAGVIFRGMCLKMLKINEAILFQAVLERVRTRTRTQWVSPSPSPDSSLDSDSGLMDSDSDSDSTSVDSDSSAVDSDSGLMDSDSDSDSTQVDSDSQWVQVSLVRNAQDKFKLSCAIMDEIRGKN